MKSKTVLTTAMTILATLMSMHQASAAIALDRTRVIVNGSENSVSLNISNENKQLPYLAQSWLEDEKGNKISSPLAVLPPVQRLEPGAKSQVKVQVSSGIAALPNDRESLYYFNLREIPPRSKKPNTLQIALQTRIKLFYRPKAIELDKTEAANGQWVEKVTLNRQGDKFIVNNPTPYYLTLVDGAASAKAQSVSFKPVMVSPKSQQELLVSANQLGNNPVLTYINDYGGRPKIQFSCSSSVCSAKLLKN